MITSYIYLKSRDKYKKDLNRLMLYTPNCICSYKVILHVVFSVKQRKYLGTLWFLFQCLKHYAYEILKYCLS